MNSVRSAPSDSCTPSAATKLRPRTGLGLTLALISILFWGSNAVIIRHLALEDVSMSVLAFLRVLIGGVMLSLWVMLTEPACFRGSTLHRDRWVWLALLCYGGNMLVFHWALRYTSASVVMLLENVAPVVTLFGGAWLFREPITARSLAALTLALGGVYLVCAADPGMSVAADSGATWGNALALLAGLTWGGFTLACRGQGRGAMGAQNGVLAMAFMLLGSSVLLLPLLVGAHGWPATPAAWGWVFLLGLAHTAFATVLWRLALTHISAYTASLLFLLTIVFTMGNAVLFLHERLTLLMLLGGGCICCALFALMGIPSSKVADSKQP